MARQAENERQRELQRTAHIGGEGEIAKQLGNLKTPGSAREMFKDSVRCPIIKPAAAAAGSEKTDSQGGCRYVS